MQEKANKPALRFKGFDEVWEQRKLKEEVTEIIAGGDVDKNLLHQKGQYPVIANALTDEGIIGYYDTEYRITAPAVTVTGRGDIGHARARTDNFTPVVRLLSIKSSHDVFFLENAINTLKIVVESTGVPQLTVPQLEKYELYFPNNHKEEEIIGLFFQKINNLITLHQRKYTKLVNIKKAMLEKMFPKNGEDVPEIRFAGFTDPWEQRKLGNIGQTYTGLSGKTKEDFGHGDASFITYMNVFSNPVANPNMIEPIEIDQKQNEVKVGDVFFTTSSETPEEVGMTSVLLEKYGKTYLNSFCFGFRPTEKFDNYFLAYMLRSHSVREKITLLAQGISRYNISKNKVMEITISVPTPEEQKCVGEYFRLLDTLITLHQRKLEKLQHIKKACLEKMFV